jgi:hypothetical protein
MFIGKIIKLSFEIMKYITFALFIFLAQQMLSQVLTNEQKDFCIATFGNYLNVQEDLIKERVEILNSLNTTEADIVWFKDNIIRMDSVMNASIALAKKDDCINLANLLEKERYNIYAIRTVTLIYATISIRSWL